VLLGDGLSQMFAIAKLADAVPRVKPDALRQRETRAGGLQLSHSRRAGDLLLHPDLNYSNRPVRTRMPGGVGGAAGVTWPPIPIYFRIGIAEACS
jgi:imidazolonepropionase